MHLLDFGTNMEGFRIDQDYYVVKFTVPEKFVGYFVFFFCLTIPNINVINPTRPININKDTKYRYPSDNIIIN